MTWVEAAASIVVIISVLSAAYWHLLRTLERLIDSVTGATLVHQHAARAANEAGEARLHATMKAVGILADIATSNAALLTHEDASRERRARNESLGRLLIQERLTRRVR